jgi:hypothetical protein
VSKKDLYLTTVLELYDRKIIGWSLKKWNECRRNFIGGLENGY